MPIGEDQKTDSGELFQAKLNGNQEIVHKTASHSGRRGEIIAQQQHQRHGKSPKFFSL